jgi:PAS domain S-box-containing protein
MLMRNWLSGFTSLLGQLRLWQQFVLLGLFVVIVPIISTTLRFLYDGEAILTEHEIIDLSDEANLRANEFREEIERVSRDVAQEARSLAVKLANKEPLKAPDICEEQLASFVAQWPMLVLKPGEIPSTVGQVRRRHFDRCIVLSGVVNCDQKLTWGTRVGADANPIPRDAPLDSAINAAVEDLSLRVRRQLPKDPSYVSNLHLQENGAADPKCYIALGWPIRWVDRQPTDLVVLVLDFTRYVRNRGRSSPRHQYIVAAANGQLLVYPEADKVETRQKLSNVTTWSIPEIAWRAERETNKTREARHAIMVRDGGSRLAGVEIPALRHFYTKGYFGGELGALLKERGPDAISELNATLFNTAEVDPRFRYGEVSLNSGYIELSHPDPKRIDRMMKHIADWWDETRGGAGKSIDWSSPLDCINFQGQITHLRLDSNEDDEPPRLIVAASLEELRQDIDTKFARIVWNWVIPTVGVATGITVFLIVLLTRSLQKLARTATTLTDPNAFSQISSISCKEVDELQSALRGMATRLSDDAARYSTILRTAGEGIVVTDPDGVIEVANRAAAKMFGQDQAEDLLSKPVQSLLEDSLPSSLTQATNADTANREVLRGRRKDGSLFWLEVTIRPVMLKNRMVMTCIFRDISLRRAQEEQIRSMNEELESRVRIRTAELAEANTKLEVALKQAEAASKAKDAFVANMSHELRQPLHIIIGFTEALKEEAVDTGRTELIADLNKILTAAKHLLDLINDILDLAKIAAGRMELSFSRFTVQTMLNEVKTLVGPLAEKNGNRFEVETSANLGEMMADERRVRQMLINLLSNAFKFTNQGVVNLNADRVHKDDRDWICFRIKDTGKGMTAQQVSLLFQRFYQADASTTREAGGTGLGLAITQSFNELMKGMPIEVESTQGQGSQFTVRLPVDVQAAAPSVRVGPRVISTRQTGELAASIPGGTGGVVLVIDDDPMVQELMKRFLLKEGFQVVTASTGPEGLRLASELKPVAITLDVMMPGTDGWTVLASLKLNSETCDIPVIMLTIVDDRGRGYALGAADYLTKPIDWQRLGTILKKYLPSDRKAPVLVIDDDPECRNMLQRYLEREGLRIVTAEDGEAGLAAYAQESPSLILLDLMMPQLDGFGFLEELSHRFPASQTPVIILTAKDLTAEDFDRLNGRVAKILEKSDSGNLEELLKLVRRHARHRGATDEAANRR